MKEALEESEKQQYHKKQNIQNSIAQQGLLTNTSPAKST